MNKLTVLLAAVTLYSCSAPKDQPATAIPKLSVLKISNSNPVTYQEYPASIEGAVNVEIRPQVGGILERIYVDEGAYVSKGQPLFKIQDQPYVERLNNAKAAQQAAEGSLAHSQLEVDRIVPLVENKVVADIQLRTANANLAIARANLERAKADVAAARINLGYTTITAPVSGFLGRLETKQGSLVGPGDVTSLTNLSDVHDVHVYFSLSEDDFVSFKQQYNGNTLQEKIDQLPTVSLVLSDNTTYPIQGKIDMVDGQFDKATAAITLRASFANSNGVLRSGNTGRIRLALQHQNVSVIPIDATFEVQDKVFVYTVGDSNKVNKQPVVLAGKSGTSYLVKNGLKPGDRIVTEGIDHLEEGGIIQPLAEKQEAKTALLSK